MFEWIKKLLGTQPKVEPKVAKPDPVYEPKFCLPGSLERYREIRDTFLETESERLAQEEMALWNEREGLLEETDPISRELNVRKIRTLQKKSEQNFLDLKTLEMRAFRMALKQVMSEECEQILSTGLIHLRSEKPKLEICREVRLIIEYQGRIFVIGQFVGAIMKETGKIISERTENGTTFAAYQERIPTGEFDPPTLMFITDSLAQLSTKELEALKEKGVICNNINNNKQEVYFENLE